jgi:hypothetical protein
MSDYGAVAAVEQRHHDVNLLDLDEPEPVAQASENGQPGRKESAPPPYMYLTM